MRSSRSSRAARNLPSTCVARGFQPLPFFLFSGGPGLAGWILYRSTSLVVDACCKKFFTSQLSGGNEQESGQELHGMSHRVRVIHFWRIVRAATLEAETRARWRVLLQLMSSIQTPQMLTRGMAKCSQARRGSLRTLSTRGRPKNSARQWLQKNVFHPRPARIGGGCRSEIKRLRATAARLMRACLRRRTHVGSSMRVYFFLK